MGPEEMSGGSDGRDNEGPIWPERQKIVDQFADLFVQRTDTFALQRPHSRLYRRVFSHGAPAALTPQILHQHLAGQLTVGLYSIDQTGRTKWSVIDSDRGIDPLISIRSDLARLGVSSYLELSRAGGHLWIFWETSIPTRLHKKILSPLVGNLELFPAGDIPDEDGIGLLIRAPLGIHQLSGKRYPFVDDNLEPVSPGLVRGQIAWLSQNVQRSDWKPLLALVPPEPLPRRPSRNLAIVEGESKPIAAWLTSHHIRQVVGEYVVLSRSGLGHCPWGGNHKHNDKHPSFAVYDRTQKWWCFAEQTGGNAFDFLCRYYQCDAKSMLIRLQRLR